jgi:signal transduction histidine kinase
MQHLLDVLASGVHDAKNQLFIAESLVGSAEAKAKIDLSEVRYAIESAANRLSQTLSTYHLLRHGSKLAIAPTIISDLCEEVGLAQKHHLAESHITLTIDCQVEESWPIDRDLVSDALNNAVQNAARYAKSQIALSAIVNEEGLCLRVEDDGPGFAMLPPENGTGLLLAERLAEMHLRRQIHGRLHLANGGTLGGAIFEFHLP